jgi:hypothetical protein
MAARQPMSVAGDTKCLLLATPNFMHGKFGRLSGARLNPEIFAAILRANRNDPVRKMLLGG